MQAGNIHYRTVEDIPSTVPVFPLSAALLLPGGRMPLNIFESRYLAMVDAAMAGNRLIGMIQPSLDERTDQNGDPELCEVGGLGRVVSFAETGDGRYLIGLQGICRFRVVEELETKAPFRQCRISAFVHDLDTESGASEIDRPALLRTLKAYLEVNELDADWDGISRAENAALVNALSMISPYGAAEKQALLEAPDLRTRAETLIAITELALAKSREGFGQGLQ